MSGPAAATTRTWRRSLQKRRAGAVAPGTSARDDVVGRRRWTRCSRLGRARALYRSAHEPVEILPSKGILQDQGNVALGAGVGVRKIRARAQRRRHSFLKAGRRRRATCRPARGPSARPRHASPPRDHGLTLLEKGADDGLGAIRHGKHAEIDSITKVLI